MYVYMYVYCVCVRACVCACVCVHVRACVSACMHVCVHVCTCVHECIMEYWYIYYAYVCWSNRYVDTMEQYDFTLLRVAMLLLILHCVGQCTGNKYCNSCPSNSYKRYLICEQDTCDWLLLNGLWAGNVTEGSNDVMICDCPNRYCFYNDSGPFVRIPSNDNMVAMMDRVLCNATHRTGILCGQCQPGYAPAINYGGRHSSECVPCDEHSSKVNWIYYILSVYVPLLVVFLVIIVFNIRLTTGPLNSFILFAQVISSSLGDSDQEGIAGLHGLGSEAFEKSYQIPYNLFNLNIFGSLLPPFCLHESLNTLDTIALRYVVGFFPLLIILATVLLVRCQRCLKMGAKLPPCFQNCQAGTSLQHAFAAFVLLSYNQLCQVTAYLLTPVSVFDQSFQEVNNRVYFQGDYLTTDATYTVRYKLPALLVTILLVLVPIALLHYPLRWVERLVSKVSCLKKVYPSASIAILLDTFQGCFKDNRRYFAGLYLALRLLLFFAFLQPLRPQLLIQQILFIVYAFLVAFLKPYKDKLLNYLDIAMFTDIALINAVSAYAANHVETDSVPALLACIIIGTILVFLPLLYFIAYLLWHGTKRCHTGAMKKTKEWYGKVRALRGARGGGAPRVILETSESHPSNDALFMRLDYEQYRL